MKNPALPTRSRRLFVGAVFLLCAATLRAQAVSIEQVPVYLQRLDNAVARADPSAVTPDLRKRIDETRATLMRFKGYAALPNHERSTVRQAFAQVISIEWLLARRKKTGPPFSPAANASRTRLDEQLLVAGAFVEAARDLPASVVAPVAEWIGDTKALLADPAAPLEALRAQSSKLQTLDPCEERARRAWSRIDFREADAREILALNAQGPCLDASLSRDAADYLRDHPAPAAPAPVPKAVEPAMPAAAATAQGRKAAPSKMAKKNERIPATVQSGATQVRPAEGPEQPARERRILLGMDVWQSAWGDFKDLQSLVDYAKQNSIRSINLNPGRAVSFSMSKDAYAQLKPLLHKLRAGGIEEINYLYAELNYPISDYVQFLNQHKDLNFTTLVDDSEFIDATRTQFERNMRTVKNGGLQYAAFITLESVGNSGVSDSLRRWGIANIDVPILMSYFGCSVDEQKEALAPYLEFADQSGRERAVRVAILLGSKSVGRERSCEQALDAAQMQAFLAELDQWCRRYRSYGGLVMETNQKLPRYRIWPQ